MKSYINAMRNGMNFQGRASRSEFWLFGLIVFLISVVTAILDVALGFADEGALVLTGIVSLVHIIPQVAVSVRRLHDIDKSGWWLLVGMIGIGVIILLVLFCLQSTPGPNRFGPAQGGNAGNHTQNGPYNANEAQSAGDGSNARGSGSQGAHTAPSDSTSHLEQLEKLKALFDGGAIDEGEFARLKADLIGKAT